MKSRHTEWRTENVVPDLRSVSALRVGWFTDNFPYIKYEAETGIGRINGEIKMSVLMANGHIGIWQEGGELGASGGKFGERGYCDDPQLIASLARTLEGLDAYFNEGHTAPGDKPQPPNILELGENFADAPVLSRKEAEAYLSAHAIPHPATPV